MAGCFLLLVSFFLGALRMGRGSGRDARAIRNSTSCAPPFIFCAFYSLRPLRPLFSPVPLDVQAPRGKTKRQARASPTQAALARADNREKMADNNALPDLMDLRYRETCLLCGTSLRAHHRSDQVFCSKLCQQRYARRLRFLYMVARQAPRAAEDAWTLDKPPSPRVMTRMLERADEALPAAHSPRSPRRSPRDPTATPSAPNPAPPLQREPNPDRSPTSLADREDRSAIPNTPETIDSASPCFNKGLSLPGHQPSSIESCWTGGGEGFGVPGDDVLSSDGTPAPCFPPPVPQTPENQPQIASTPSSAPKTPTNTSPNSPLSDDIEPFSTTSTTSSPESTQTLSDSSEAWEGDLDYFELHYEYNNNNDVISDNNDNDGINVNDDINNNDNNTNTNNSINNNDVNNVNVNVINNDNNNNNTNNVINNITDNNSINVNSDIDNNQRYTDIINKGVNDEILNTNLCISEYPSKTMIPLEGLTEVPDYRNILDDTQCVFGTSVTRRFLYNELVDKVEQRTTKIVDELFPGVVCWRYQETGKRNNMDKLGHWRLRGGYRTRYPQVWLKGSLMKHYRALGQVYLLLRGDISFKDFTQRTPPYDYSHLCHNYWCCNPAHGIAETHKVNLGRICCASGVLQTCLHPIKCLRYGLNMYQCPPPPPPHHSRKKSPGDGDETSMK